MDDKVKAQQLILMVEEMLKPNWWRKSDIHSYALLALMRFAALRLIEASILLGNATFPVEQDLSPRALVHRRWREHARPLLQALNQQTDIEWSVLKGAMEKVEQDESGAAQLTLRSFLGLTDEEAQAFVNALKED